MEERKWKTAVVTLSDKGYTGKRVDESGPAICEIVSGLGFEVEKSILLPDEKEEIKKCLCKLCDEYRMDIVFTTGGTGLSQRDCTPEATMEIAQRNVPGISEAMRLYSLNITPMAMLSRGVSVIRGKTLIINLPGSPRAVRENLEAVLPALGHALGVLTGRDTDCGNTSGGRPEEEQSGKVGQHERSVWQEN